MWQTGRIVKKVVIRTSRDQWIRKTRHPTDDLTTTLPGWEPHHEGSTLRRQPWNKEYFPFSKEAPTWKDGLQIMIQGQGKLYFSPKELKTESKMSGETKKKSTKKEKGSSSAAAAAPKAERPFKERDAGFAEPFCGWNSWAHFKVLRFGSSRKWERICSSSGKLACLMLSKT